MNWLYKIVEIQYIFQKKHTNQKIFKKTGYYDDIEWLYWRREQNHIWSKTIQLKRQTQFIFSKAPETSWGNEKHTIK